MEIILHKLLKKMIKRLLHRILLAKNSLNFIRLEMLANLLSFLKNLNSIGDANIEDVLNDYIAFYEDRIERGLPVDRPSCPYNAETLKDRKLIKANMLTNPFEKFERKRFLYHSKDLGVISMNHALFARMEEEDFRRIKEQMEEDLRNYYRDMGV